MTWARTTRVDRQICVSCFSRELLQCLYDPGMKVLDMHHRWCLLYALFLKNAEAGYETDGWRLLHTVQCRLLPVAHERPFWNGSATVTTACIALWVIAWTESGLPSNIRNTTQYYWSGQKCQTRQRLYLDA
jgi:hypothetical protein